MPGGIARSARIHTFPHGGPIGAYRADGLGITHEIPQNQRDRTDQRIEAQDRYQRKLSFSAVPGVIDVAPNVEQYFEAIVREAIEARGVEVSEASGHYLALLLTGYARGELGSEALDGPLTFLLRDALQAAGVARFQRLQAIGDGVLYVLGFFGGALTRGGADRGYVMGIGASAYEHASTMMRLGGVEGVGHDVLGELSQYFDRFVEVVTEVADGALAGGGHDDASVLRLYERWRRTGSTRLAEALGSLGFSPQRNPGGVN